jgi:hypothetical protein
MKGKNAKRDMATTIGTFQFKVKSYDNEEGEYSQWQQTEPGTIIQFILAHWFNETLPNNLDVIVIKNGKGDQLVIDHENKDVFRFFLIPWDSGLFYYYKMTDIRFMFFTLEHFFSGLLETLQENLNKTMDDWRWVKGDFIGKNFHHKIKEWRVVTTFLTPVLILLGLLILVLITPFTGFTALRMLYVVAGLLVLLYAWSTVRKIRWFLDQRFLQVQLSKGDRFIHVWHRGQKTSIPKTDITAIEQHWVSDSFSDNDTWFPSYTQIDFKNGDRLNIHRLLMPQYDMAEKFFQERHLFREIHSGQKGIQKKTSLSGYLPKAASGWKTYLK